MFVNLYYYISGSKINPLQRNGHLAELIRTKKKHPNIIQTANPIKKLIGRKLNKY